MGCPHMVTLVTNNKEYLKSEVIKTSLAENGKLVVGAHGYVLSDGYLGESKFLWSPTRPGLTHCHG